MLIYVYMKFLVRYVLLLYLLCSSNIAHAHVVPMCISTHNGVCVCLIRRYEDREKKIGELGKMVQVLSKVRRTMEKERRESGGEMK